VLWIDRLLLGFARIDDFHDEVGSFRHQPHLSHLSVCVRGGDTNADT
jgi:hypothetical protein